MDSTYFWVRLVTMGCLVVNVMRKNFYWRTYAKILGSFAVADNALPYMFFGLAEMNRIRLLKKQAWKYYDLTEGNMDRVQYVMNPTTPINKLRYFSL